MDILSKSGVISAEQRAQKSDHMTRSIKQFVSHKLFEKSWLLFIISFFLGRAIVLTSLSPFAVAFLATTIIVKKQSAFTVFVFLTLGALSISLQQAIYVTAACMILMFSYKLFLSKAKKLTVLMIIATLISSAIGRAFYYLVYDGQAVLYDYMILGVESLLSGFLVMIFLQSFPYLLNNQPIIKVRVEDIICIVILITAVLTGFVGITITGLGLEQVGSKYFILISAYIAGATVGSAIGVIVGLMLSLVSTFHLYQVSLLALAGLLGGLLKSTNKYGVVVGLFVSAILIGLYRVDYLPIEQLLIECVVAACLFALTPNKLIKKIAAFVPGTEEEKEAHEQYAKKVRHATAERVERFSEMFEALSNSFAYYDSEAKQNEATTSEVDEYLSRVTENTCQTCLKKHNCWVKNFDRTYDVLQDTLQSIESNDLSQMNLNVGKLKNFCVKQEQMIDQMRYELSFYQANKRLKQQVKESRKFVSEQLSGVSEVMNNFAKEILKERQAHEWHEEEIRRMLSKLNFNVEHLDLFSIEKGNIDIEMTLYFHDYHGEGEKIIAPMLSDLLNETIILEHENPKEKRSGYRTFIFSSIKRYQLTNGVAHAAKNGNFLSGDSYLMLELGKSRYALAISDGMGNGERAYLESSETLKLLKQILQSGINEQVAIQSINSILSLRTSDEIYATLDLAILDLQKPQVNFLKIGAMMSFIIRAGGIYPVEASNIPIGILEEFDVEPVSELLKDGDILVMISDGVLETTRVDENREVWLKRILKRLETDDPQAIADLVLEEAIRSNHGEILDDMTVLVSKIEKSKPKWASFSPLIS